MYSGKILTLQTNDAKRGRDDFTFRRGQEREGIRKSKQGSNAMKRALGSLPWRKASYGRNKKGHLAGRERGSSRGKESHKNTRSRNEVTTKGEKGGIDDTREMGIRKLATMLKGNYQPETRKEVITVTVLREQGKKKVVICT